VILNLSSTWYLDFLLVSLISNVPSPATNPEIQLGSIFLNSAESAKCKGLSKTSIFFIISLMFLDKPLFKADLKTRFSIDLHELNVLYFFYFPQFEPKVKNLLFFEFVMEN
jgi:hypothetical protein